MAVEPAAMERGKGPRRVVVALTGASAMPVAGKMLAMLAQAEGVRLSCIISRGAEQVWQAEKHGDLEDLKKLAPVLWDNGDMAAGPASGSWWRPAAHAAMIIMPCSMGTLGAIASGCAANLIHRAAAVALKERVKLVLVPRETPLSAIALGNMVKVQAAGAVVMPFCPGFYFQPRSLDDLYVQFCCRVLEQIDVPFPCPQWDSVLP